MCVDLHLTCNCNSSNLNGDKPGPHGIQGISPPFVPENVDVSLIDEVIRCPTAEAIATAQNLAKMDGKKHSLVDKYAIVLNNILSIFKGIPCGISAGANVWAAMQIAKRPEMAGKRIVTVIPSAAERYFSTPLYKDVMDAAINIELAEVNKSYGQEGLNLRNLESIKKSLEAEGKTFRPNFHVS